jgi:GAF domain-containing protein
MADSLGSALENARLFSEAQESLNEIQGLHRQYLEHAWGETIRREGELGYTYNSAAAASGNSDTTVRSLQVPIRVRDQVIGHIIVEAEPPPAGNVSGAPNRWTKQERTLIETIASQTALALENARLLEETQRRAEQERVMANIAGKVWASSNIETILQTALHELGTSLQASEGIIQLDVQQESSE